MNLYYLWLLSAASLFICFTNNIYFLYIFSCDCAPGYTGPLCQHSLNECESSPCLHGICVDQEDGFRCFCQPGKNSYLFNLFLYIINIFIINSNMSSSSSQAQPVPIRRYKASPHSASCAFACRVIQSIMSQIELFTTCIEHQQWKQLNVC